MYLSTVSQSRWTSLAAALTFEPSSTILTAFWTFSLKSINSSSIPNFGFLKKNINNINKRLQGGLLINQLIIINLEIAAYMM